jgi:hypothetical protein
LFSHGEFLQEKGAYHLEHQSGCQVLQDLQAHASVGESHTS